jgi:carbamate kinase
MRVVVALGGNALLQRGQEMSAENQRANVKQASSSIAAVINADHEVIISHGNGPQVGLLALQNAAYKAGTAYPLDVLSAETVGMIGYMIERELANLFPDKKLFATLLTQIEVDPDDRAFLTPTKPIGPIYELEEATELAAAHGWKFGPDGTRYRRLVPSPAPRRICEIEVIRLLVNNEVTVICAGGGGIPVIRHSDGTYAGIEAIIDKDLASALLAKEIRADALLMLTDVDGVYKDWGKPHQLKLSHLTQEEAKTYAFPAGSMGPKVEAAAMFMREGGRLAGIGRLDDALAMLEGKAGTTMWGPMPSG